MPKKIWYIAIPAVVVIIAAFFIIQFVKPSKSIEKSTALRAIPPNSPLVISIDNAEKLTEKLNSNELFISLRNIPSLKNEFTFIDSFNSLIDKNESIKKLIHNKQLLLTLNFSGRDDLNLLTLIECNNRNDKELLNKIINNYKNDKSYTYTERKYNKTKIYEIKSGNITYNISLNKGIIIISKKALLLEEAIRISDSDLAQDDKELTPLLKTVGQANIHLFINYKQINRFLKEILSENIQHKSTLLKIFSGWTELDLNINNNNLLLTGFSNGAKENNYYSNIFLNQHSLNSNIERVLPQSTNFYLNICLSDINTFFSDYKNFLEKRNLYFQRTGKLDKIKSQTGTDFQQFIIDNINEEVVFAGTQIDQNSPKDGRVWIMKTKSGTNALNTILEIQKKYIDVNKLSINNWQKDYSIDNQTSFTIHKFPYPELPHILFGQIFKEAKANWVTIYDNYLIFGDSFRSVAKVVHSNILGETLSGSMEYDSFKSNLNSRSNINFYCNTAASLPVANLLFNEEIGTELTKIEELRKFKAAAWQITSTGEMLYNNVCLTYSSDIKSKPQTIWQSHIENSFDCKPTFVTNHYDRANKEIIIHDNANNFYLINNVGRILWQIKLDAPIIGNIHQIDYFSNGKLQYIFNTENKLYIVDREGNNVKNFPINFRAKATNAVAIFDYDKSRDYRFFVACNDKKIYAYDENGNLLKGWNIFQTDHIVTQPLQHFRLEGKDYIVASDNMKDYILHRRGTIRVQTNNIYEHSANNTLYLENATSTHKARMVTTGADGTLHYTYFNGNHETVNRLSLNSNHYFESANLDNDENNEYVYTSGNILYLFDDNGKQLLKKKFSKNISHKPNIYSFSSSVKKIGITCKTENKIYLFDIKGKSHPGFPLDGCTEFSIGFISSEKSNFNLLVGSPDSYLYNYYVE